jgi:hypothetical protein
MILSRRTFLALAVAVSTSRAAAQVYPTKPIRLIVPFPPGGGTDILARVLGNRLSQTFGQPVVVENKPGAGGNIGVDAVAKAAPDGYTLVLGQTSNLAINPTLYPRLPYDPLKDLAPIALVASAPLVLVVQSGSPYRSLADIVTAAKAKPDTITFASPGSGTVAHLTGELLQREAGLKFQHVPYKGAAQAIGPDGPHPHQGWAPASDRGDLGQARARAAGRAHRGGSRLSRHGGSDLVRPARASRHPVFCDYSVSRGDEPCPGDPGGAREDRRRGG